MGFLYEEINCQEPPNYSYTTRKFIVVKATLNKTTSVLAELRNDAWRLAESVNPRRANNSTTQRDKDRLILDAAGGLLAEKAWLFYINRLYGEGTALPTVFVSAHGQIDIQLSNGKSIEIRSSFPRNGVKFAICHERYNFKNICKYDNLYKPSEVDKDFFGSVLFETPKERLLDMDGDTVLYLIGGSTKAMMQNDNIAFNASLVAEDDLTETKTNYRVVYLKDALDMKGFESYMESLGFSKKNR